MGKRKNSRPTKLKINENLTSELQIKEEAKRIHKLSESQPKTAAQLIRKLCKEHTNIGYLFWVQTDMLQRRHNDATEPHVRKQHLDEAKLSANKAIELNPKSILFAYTLGLVYSKEVLETNDWRAAIERFDTAIQQYNTALQIENPTDPFHDGYEPEPEPGSLRAIYKGTYDQRIKGVRGIICRDLAGCLRKLMVLKTETSIIKASLERLEMDEDEKVKISWISLRPVDKKRFVKVKIRYLISHIRESRNHFASEILEQALDFNGAHEEWKFWLCYCCEERFPDYESLLLHASATHWEGLFSKHRETFPLRVDDWAPFMNKTWMAIDSSAARIMLEQKQELLSAKRNKSSNIGNDKVIEKNQITEEPSSSGGEVQSLEEERDLQETPEVDATFELLNYDENPWLKKDILRWDWPSPKDVDARRSYLLKLIQDRLNNLKLGRCVLAAHMDILIQRAMSKMDDLYRDLLKELSVDQTHYCLCLLDASELKEIFRFLHNISEFSKKISKQGTIMEDTPDYDTWASEREGLIMLTANSKSLILILLNGHTLSEQSVSESSSAGSACTDGGGSKTQDPPDIDYLFSWLSLNSSSYEHLKEWRKLRDKRRQHGREELNKCEERLLESLENVYESQEPSASENNDTGLSNTVERILQIAEDMRQFESIHERFAAYDYQPILLSIVMPYTRQCMESIIDDYVAMKYNAAAAVDGMGDESTAPEKEAAKECKATDVMADENTSAENEATGECKAIDEDLAAGHGGEEGVHNWSTSGSNKGMQEEQIIEGKGTLSSTGQRPTGHEGDQILQDGFTAVLSKAEKKRMKKQNAAKANQWDQQVRYMKAESTRQEKLDYEGFAINEVEEAMRQSLENLQEPTEDASTSKKDAPKPTEDVLHLEDAPKPAEDAPEPTEDVPQLEDAPVPAEDASNPAKDAREPTEHASEPTEHPPKPSEDVPQLEDAPELAEDALKPMEDAPKPTVDAPGPTEDASEPAENVPQLEDVPDPAKDASAATEDAPNPADNVPQLEDAPELVKDALKPASDAPELAKDAPEPTEDAPKQADDVPQLEDAPETAEDVRVEDIPKPAEDASEPAKNVPEEDSPGPESTKNAPEEDTPEPAEDVPEGDDPDPAEDATEPAVDGMGDESAAPEKDAAEECKATDVMADTGEDAPDTSEDVRVEDTPKPAEDASEPAKNVPEEDSPGPESAKNAPEEDSTVSEEDAPEPAEDVPEEDDPDPAADAPEEESTEDDPEEDDPDPAEDAPEEDSTVPEADPPEPAEDVPEVDDPDPAEDAPEPEEDVSDPGVVIFGSIPCLLRR